ncbi:MAG: hypothetical protein JXN59_15575 [Anaerolineae bacterium]|nr:hypothetical protein [Anaerolineae bacterium]
MVNAIKKRAHPRVILAERVIRKMARGASIYRDEETAEALVGLIVPAEDGPPDFYVLDTIAPAQDAIERAGYMVEQGDDLQDAIMYWLAINWKRFREARSHSYGSALAAKWDAPLRYLGDWHKQPGDMFWPSGGDLETARAIVQDEANDMPELIAPIVTLASPWDSETGPAGDDFDLYATQDDGLPIRVNIWYLNRDLREFIAARPDVMADDLLPAMPPLAWHLTDHERFQQEYDLLAADGLAVSVVEWDADERPPLEVCFMVGRMGGSRVLILITGVNYPVAMPGVRVAPMLKVQEDEDLFERLWAESTPFDAAGLKDFTWQENCTLLDLVHAVEAAL